MAELGAARAIGDTGLAVSPLGLGTASLGNLYAPISDDHAADIVAAALAAGVSYVDTAPYYGFGLSEVRVGAAIAGHEDVILSSKVGRLLDPDPDVIDDRERHGFRSTAPFSSRFDYRGDAVLRSHEDSLARLGVDRIDMLFVHDIGALTHGDAADRHLDALTRGGGFDALERLKREGAIRAYGIGVNEIDICLTLIDRAPIDAILLAGRYTLLDHGDALDRLLPLCVERGISLVIGGPYNSGILATGSSSVLPRYDYAPAPVAIVERVAVIEAVCARHQVTLAAAALAFILAHPAIASVIPGCAGPAEVAAAVAHATTPIPADLWTEMRDAGLIDPRAPVPGARVA